MLFRQKLKQGLILPDMSKDGQAMCMDTYRWMFDCSRVPGEGLDWCVSYAKEGDIGDSGHIVVIRKNRIYKVDVTDNGRILSTSEIKHQIQIIYDSTIQEYPSVGVLTASHRDVWAKDYVELKSSPNNREILEAINSSAFVVVLDSSLPEDPIHHSHALWHGDVVNGIPVGLRNRWLDKPLQFIIFDNGYAGFMGEHSLMDGTPTTRMCDEVLDMLYHPAFDHGSPIEPTNKIPTALDWDVTLATANAIIVADHAAIEIIESQDLGFYLTSYGRVAIKKSGVSPDAWTQMIIQLAYKRLNGSMPRMGGTYEAATTRKFYKGRTEVILVATTEADNWARSMDDAEFTLQDRKRLFDEAAKKHRSLIKAAREGKGLDCHLLGLRQILREDEPLPEMYDDPVFKRLFRWVLSTSTIFSKHFPVYGWGEVVHDGFGVAYMTGYDDRLQFTITSRKETPNAQFVQEIARAAHDLYELHRRLSLEASVNYIAP